MNFGFDEADAIVCVGYHLQEFDPVKSTLGRQEELISHRCPAEIDAHYPVTVSVEGNL